MTTALHGERSMADITHQYAGPAGGLMKILLLLLTKRFYYFNKQSKNNDNTKVMMAWACGYATPLGFA